MSLKGVKIHSLFYRQKPKSKEPSPLLFNLTTLQKQANKQLNLTAEETLNIAQSLYEKKFITYPRTGSGYIPEDLWNEIPHLIKSLLGRETCKEAAYKIIRDHFNKRIVNDLRVYDHHGLLITGKLPSALSARENAVYDMIAFRLLEALSDDCIREIREAKLQVLHYDFILKGSKVIQAGWHQIKGHFLITMKCLLRRCQNLKMMIGLRSERGVLWKRKPTRLRFILKLNCC